MEEPYHLMEEDGYDFSHPPSLDDFVAQLERSIEELNEGAENVLFDRSPIDFLGYIAVHDDAGDFDFEAAILNYIRSAETLPSFVAHVAGEPVGLALVKRHFTSSAELYLVGVMPAHHRRGVGRALLRAIEQWLRQEGVRFLQVKTLSARSKDATCASTREFYLNTGVAPLEELPTLWDERNPCLLLIEHLSDGDRE